MSPELEKQVASLVEAAKEAGSDAASFIAQHAPETIEQLLAWETTRSVIGCGVFVALALLFVGLGLYCRGKSSLDHPPPVVPYTVAVFMVIASLMFVSRIVKVQVAPNIVVLEAVSQLASRR